MKNPVRNLQVGLLFAAACFLSLTTPRTYAQTAATGSINGTITDTSGALVPNASVEIIDTDTGAHRKLTASSSGGFSTTFLQPGNYEIIFSAGAAFAKVDRKNIIVRVGESITVDEALPAASVSAEVTVTDASPLIQPDKVDMSQTVDATLVSNLPVNGRRYDNFVLLTPNVVPDGTSGLLSFRGVSGLYNTNLIDGANNQQALFSEARGRATGAPYVFSQDSIREFQASASGYSAEFGQAAGGQINAITKSGTNALHGDLFYYLRYPSLNALDPVSKYSGRLNNNPTLLQPAIHQQQQFGGSVGGPIIKDKLFYFATYDGFRKVTPLLYSSTIAASALAAYTCPAPVTTVQCTAAKNFVAGLSGAVPRTQKQDLYFPRLDYQLNGTNHISAEFNFLNFHFPNGYTSGPTASNNSVSANGTTDFHERVFIASWESALSSTSANVVRFQWSRDLEVTGANAPGPNVTISGLQAYGLPNALPRGALPDEHRWQVLDTYSKTFGKHTLKAGFDLNLIHDHVQNLFQGGGLYSYAALTNQCLNPADQPNFACTATSTTHPSITGAPGAFANYVQDVFGLNGGQHYSTFTQVNDPITHLGIDDFWNQNIAGFAEDAWKVTPKLNITAGVRYDLQLVPAPPHPYTTSYNGVASPLGNFFTNTIHTNTKMFQPRIGFAFNPMPGTVIRGGYGIFYGLTSNSTFYATRVENGVYQQGYTFQVAQAGGGAGAETYTYPTGSPQNTNVLFTPPGLPLAAPFAGAVTPTVQSGNAALTKLSFRGQSPNFTNPYTHSIDLSVEQELPGKVSFTLSYVGTRGMRLPFFIDANQPRTTLTRNFTYTDKFGAAQSVTVPFYSSALARPSPNDGGILVGYSGVNTWYNSGVVSIRKPFSHQVELLVNYTWAKNIDGGQVPGQFGTYNGTDTILDPFNLKGTGTLGEYARSDLDVRGRFVGSIVWSPKYNYGFRPASLLLNGWSVSGTATEQTGTPLTAGLSANPGGGLEGGATGGEVGNSPSPSTGRSPNLKRNAIPGPGIHNVDARLSRDFAIHDNIRFQIFAEAFNLANAFERLGVSSTAYTAVSAAGGNFSLTPYTSTPFGTPTSSQGILYGPRQLQFTAKLFF